jgi:hypothetical protein
MSTISKILDEGQGILKLKPTWVPRSFCRPGKRIKLHPDDYYVLGLERGGINERWLSSTTKADNGPSTPEDEGLSYVVSADGKNQILLKTFVEELKEKLLGETLWERYGCWAMFSKFFDNAGPLPHHIHHGDKHAKNVGEKGKHEMYFFPAQMNNHGGEFPFTFLGLVPSVSKETIKNCLINFAKGDNKILDYSQAYKLTLDTGWDVPPGLLHAPGSLCTYEPQFSSDVYAMYQSVLYGGQCVSEEFLWKNSPESERGNFDYLMDIINWEINADADLYKNRFMAPITIFENAKCKEEWICYKYSEVSAKRLTVYPGQSVKVSDSSPYGLILLQGKGKMGVWDIETPTLIRYGQITSDEFFVSYNAAANGVEITNTSEEPLVMLKHFSYNPELTKLNK